MKKSEIAQLENLVRVGYINSVDTAERTARVRFPDKNDLISGPLKVLQRPPGTAVSKTPLTYGGETQEHTHEATVTPWLPSIDDMVVCLYLPNGGTGFVLGAV